MEIKEREIKEAEIVVVDDSSIALKKMKNILTDHNFRTVKTYQNPYLFLEEFDKYKPALVILDYEMPDLSGKEVLENLMEKYEKDEVNVLFWTALSDQSLVTEVLDKGARDILSKDTISDQEILSRVQNQIESHLYHRKLHDHNRKLNKKVQKHARELEKSRQETIIRLVKTAEFRDNETADHIERIGLLTEKLAKLYGLDESICSAIRYGAPMHDIGKMGLPDDILFKPDKLTSEEWIEMKKHPVYGAKILSDSESKYTQLAKNIAHFHHENWNGQGYPEGLEGPEIPLEARLTAVCDVFDAVLSQRPYKEPWTYEEAIELIRKQKGKKFDPNIAECFLEHANEMIALRKNYTDESQTEPLTNELSVVT